MNTPRTDAACGWPWGHHGRIETGDLRRSPDGPFVHSSVARELERENAALRKDKDRFDWLITTAPFCVLSTLSSDPAAARLKIDREMEFPTV